ncbi:MAG TPA: ACT domain-containing protein [Candidatus Limnocylindria bacterium]|nr:ACT domain-containing protein [Candidatus Limnocylindria bacterium]
MATDLTINLGNKPGTLAHIGEVLGNAGINIEGVSGAADDDSGLIHLLVADAGMARSALEAAGVECDSERSVEVVSVVDQPGELGRHLRRVADAGINVDLVYLATGTRLVLGSLSDGEGLRGALHGS